MILLVALPSTIVTSLNTTFSPLTPSLRTLVFPFGNVLSSFLIVSKGITSMVVLSSGLFIDKLSTPSSGVVLYSIFGFEISVSCLWISILGISISSTFSVLVNDSLCLIDDTFVSLGRIFSVTRECSSKSFCVKNPIYLYPDIWITPLASSEELVIVVFVLYWTKSLFSKAKEWYGTTTLCPRVPIKTTLSTLFLCFFEIKSTIRTAVPRPKPASGSVLSPVLGNNFVFSVSALALWLSFL